MGFLCYTRKIKSTLYSVRDNGQRSSYEYRIQDQMAKGVTVGSLPADSEQFMLIEELYKQIDKLQIRVDSMLHNEVGIKALEKSVDKLQKDVEKLKDKQRAFANGNQ
jgi:chaperonin cofactor prefoldin